VARVPIRIGSEQVSRAKYINPLWRKGIFPKGCLWEGELKAWIILPDYSILLSSFSKEERLK